MDEKRPPPGAGDIRRRSDPTTFSEIIGLWEVIDGTDAVRKGRVEPATEKEEWISALLIVKLDGRAAEEIVLRTCVAGSRSSTRSRISTSCIAPVVGWRSTLFRSAQRWLLGPRQEGRRSVKLYPRWVGWLSNLIFAAGVTSFRHDVERLASRLPYACSIHRRQKGASHRVCGSPQRV